VGNQFSRVLSRLSIVPKRAQSCDFNGFGEPVCTATNLWIASGTSIAQTHVNTSANFDCESLSWKRANIKHLHVTDSFGGISWSDSVKSVLGVGGVSVTH
jgi:hypothetical protein